MQSGLEKAAARTLRSALIETITATIPEYSVADTYNLSVESIPLDVEQLLDSLLEPSEPSTCLYPVLDKDGKIQDFGECPRDTNEMGTSTASMSLNRKPFLESSSIKGSSSNLPFYPGGFGDALDNVLSFACANKDADIDDLKLLETDDFLNCPPGFEEGIDLVPFELTPDVVPGSGASEVSKIVDLETADIFELMDLVGGVSILPPEPAINPLNHTEEVSEHGSDDPKSNVSLEEDSLIEIEQTLVDVIVTTNDTGAAYSMSATQYHYARELPTTADIPEYKKIVPTMAKQYPFDLDPFQQAAVLCMENGESVFVAAHTSAGKTVVAEYAVALCKQHKTRAIYTSPIKALSNQKFRDFKILFEDVGLVTGDIQLNPEAFCLIMTTEILRSMLYNGSEVIRDLEWVVFDEVHYINNAERGHVWEEVLIMLPAHVKIVMLSATVPNCVEFADWVGRIKNRKINVVSTYKRPVPLEHYLYTGQDGKTKKDIFKVVDQTGQWLSEGYIKAIDSKKAPQKQFTAQRQGNRGGHPGGGQQGGRGGGGQHGGQHGGRGGGYQASHGGGYQAGRGGNNSGGGNNRGGANAAKGFNGGYGTKDKNVYINLIDYLRGLEQLPMVVFVFSRKRCDDYARLLESVDLTTAVEKSHVHRFFEDCVGRLKGGDKKLPQVILMRQLCMRGFAVHHSGILPILKEVVELLFQKGYVKILFATETFAMGVNMPARTVVFDSIQKHDGTQLRALNAGEYIQMAGRAGRRGLDTTGTVIVLAKGSVPEKGELELLMMGKASRLESQFRVTYSMLLNLLRVEQFRIEDMLQRSYVESASLRCGLLKKGKLDEMNERLAELPSVQCSFCSESSSLQNYHDAMISFIDGRHKLWPALFATGEKLSNGRVVIVTSAKYKLTNRVGVLLQDFTKSTIQVMIPCDAQEANPDTIRAAVTAFNKLPATEQYWAEESVMLDGACRFGLEGVNRPESGQRFFCIIDDLPLTSLAAVCKKQINKLPAVEIASEWKNRQLPRFRNNELPHSISKVIQDLDNLAEIYAREGSQISVPGVDMKVQDILLLDSVKALSSLRIQLLDPAEFPAKHCTLFEDHMKILRDRVRLEREIRQLDFELSTDALHLSEDYRNRLKVLSAMGYVENGNMVSLKGRVACEIHHMELLITELILENKLHNRSPAEVAALLSATTCQFKNNGESKFEKDSVFEQLKDDVEYVREKIDNQMKHLRVNIVEVGDDVRYDLMPVVYNWASGMPFAEIKEMTEAQEGIIVRCIQRLGEVCKDVRNAARIIGDPALHEKMEQVSAAIKRDIVFAASLYHSM